MKVKISRAEAADHQVLSVSDFAALRTFCHGLIIFLGFAVFEGYYVPTPISQGNEQVISGKSVYILQNKLLTTGTLKIYPGYPHGRHRIVSSMMSCSVALLPDRSDR